MLFSDSSFCYHLQPLSFLQCIGKKILIVGDSNVGKTQLTSQFLTYLRNVDKMDKIYVFEMGPERFQLDKTVVGGKLSDYDRTYRDDPRVNEYSYSITPPRSASKNKLEVYENCLKNYRLIYEDFKSVVENLLNTLDANSAIIINDFSIFLHLSSPISFLKILKTSHTVFVNAYYGQKLTEDFGSNISWRERFLVQLLTRHFDYSIHLMK